MSDHDRVDPAPDHEPLSLTRRTLLRLGLLSVAAAAHGPLVFAPSSVAQTGKPGANLVPNIARGWEVSPDGKVTTLLLRRGMRWSDGHPFTADDFIFWYQDLYLNKDLVPTPLSVMMVAGKPIVIEKVDASTIRFVSP